MSPYIFLQGLVHCINVAGCKGCIFEDSLQENIAQVRTELKCPIDVMAFELFRVDEEGTHLGWPQGVRSLDEVSDLVRATQNTPS